MAQLSLTLLVLHVPCIYCSEVWPLGSLTLNYSAPKKWLQVLKVLYTSRSSILQEQAGRMGWQRPKTIKAY